MEIENKINVNIDVDNESEEFEIRRDHKLLFSGMLTELPGCCGVCVMHNIYIDINCPEFSEEEVKYIMECIREQRVDEAIDMDEERRYTCFIYTHVDYASFTQKFGKYFSQINNFVNVKTDNTVRMFAYNFD